MVLLNNPVELQCLDDYTIVKKISPHYCIIYSNSPIPVYRIVLLNDLKLLSGYFIVAESKLERGINEDLAILEEYISPMLHALNMAEVKLDPMSKDQLKALILGVKETCKNSSKFTSSSASTSHENHTSSFLSNIQQASNNTSKERLESVSDFVKQVEDYSEESTRIYKYVQYLNDHPKGKLVDKMLKKLKHSMDRIERIEFQNDSYLKKMKRMSRREIGKNEAYQLDKTKKQYDMYRDKVKGYITSDIVTLLKNRELKRSTRSESKNDSHGELSRSSRHSKRRNTNHKPVSNDDDDSEDEFDEQFNLLQQQILSGEKAYVSNATMNTVEVEKLIAKERYEELERIEVDFNELMEVNQNINSLIHESTGVIKQVGSNIHNTYGNIEKGSKYVKDAKNKTLMSLFSGRFLS